MNLGEKVKNIRKELGFTQEEFSKKLNISRGYLSDIERGKIKGTFELINNLSEISGKPITFFADKEIKLKPLEIMDKTIDMLIESGEISKGYTSDWAKEMLAKVLDKEIEYKLTKED